VRVASAVVLLSLFLRIDRAGAEPVDDRSNRPSFANVPPYRLNFRAGLASDQLQRPAMCLEVALWSASIEGCGTGSGFLYDAAGRDLAHFRMNVPVTRYSAWGGSAALRAGLGFAELEVGEDRPGFQFGDPAPAERGAVAGPDAAMSFQWTRPVGRGFELVGTATAGLAWFASADRLIVPQAHFQPYVSAEIGFGW
jgi:hypothetical protein